MIFYSAYNCNLFLSMKKKKKKKNEEVPNSLYSVKKKHIRISSQSEQNQQSTRIEIKVIENSRLESIEWLKQSSSQVVNS
ncbi:hypothetical protein ANTRET_LOCUS265 [Anthophora retusa]